MKLISRQVSDATGYETTKYRVRFQDDKEAEIVRVNRPEKMIYCVSCMVGCPVGCGFCVSGNSFSRFLTAVEMTELFNVALKIADKPSLISMMGSGEPLLNAVEVRRFMKALRWGWSRFAISTSGVGIHNLPSFHDIPGMKLQISVHAVEDELRQRMIPGSPSLDEIVRYAKVFSPRVDWNFVFWKGLNDHEGVAVEIGMWAKRNRINFIKVNAARGDLIPASPRTQDIIKVLRRFELGVEFYETDGEDIQAGCGQLI